MPTLIDLPLELFVHILSFLPEIAAPEPVSLRPSSVPLIPSICHVSRLVRRESLRLYAESGTFSIHTGDAWAATKESPREGSKFAIHAWSDALGEHALGHVRSLRLSQHWQFKRPAEWKVQAGFYVSLQRRPDDEEGRKWECTVDISPVVNDEHGMQKESVELLQEVVTQRVERVDHEDAEDVDMEGKAARAMGLTMKDLKFVLRAMEIVASHPIEQSDDEQPEHGRRVWEEMEGMLRALDEGDEADTKKVEESK